MSDPFKFINVTPEQSLAEIPPVHNENSGEDITLAASPDSSNSEATVLYCDPDDEHDQVSDHDSIEFPDFESYVHLSGKKTSRTQYEILKLMHENARDKFPPPYHGTSEQCVLQYSLPPPRPRHDPSKGSPLLRMFPTKDLDLETIDSFLPEHWTAKNNKVLLKQSEYLTQEIPEESPIFNYIEPKFNLSHPRGKIIGIDEIQNPYIYIRYQIKKAELQKLYEIEEHHLFHGTNLNKLDCIFKQNLDWRLHGARVGNKFGQGVSFSPLSSYAIHYTDKRTTYNAMILARVLTGSIDYGNRISKLPADGADTSISESGKVVIKYHDNEFCPDYVIYFKYIPLVPRMKFLWSDAPILIEEEPHESKLQDESWKREMLESKTSAIATILKEVSDCWAIRFPALTRNQSDMIAETDKLIKNKTQNSSTSNEDDQTVNVQNHEDKEIVEKSMSQETSKALTIEQTILPRKEARKTDSPEIFQIPVRDSSSFVNNCNLGHQQYTIFSGNYNKSGYSLPNYSTSTPNLKTPILNQPNISASNFSPVSQNNEPYNFSFPQYNQGNTWNSRSINQAIPQTSNPTTDPIRWASPQQQSWNSSDISINNTSLLSVNPVQNVSVPQFPANNFAHPKTNVGYHHYQSTNVSEPLQPQNNSLDAPSPPKTNPDEQEDNSLNVPSPPSPTPSFPSPSLPPEKYPDQQQDMNALDAPLPPSPPSLSPSIPSPPLPPKINPDEQQDNSLDVLLPPSPPRISPPSPPPPPKITQEQTPEFVDITSSHDELPNEQPTQPQDKEIYNDDLSNEVTEFRNKTRDDARAADNFEIPAHDSTSTDRYAETFSRDKNYDELSSSSSSSDSRRERFNRFASSSRERPSSDFTPNRVMLNRAYSPVPTDRFGRDLSGRHDRSLSSDRSLPSDCRASSSDWGRHGRYSPDRHDRGLSRDRWSPDRHDRSSSRDRGTHARYSPDRHDRSSSRGRGRYTRGSSDRQNRFSSRGRGRVFPYYRGRI